MVLILRVDGFASCRLDNIASMSPTDPSGVPTCMGSAGADAKSTEPATAESLAPPGAGGRRVSGTGGGGEKKTFGWNVRDWRRSARKDWVETWMQSSCVASRAPAASWTPVKMEFCGGGIDGGSASTGVFPLAADPLLFWAPALLPSAIGDSRLRAAKRRVMAGVTRENALKRTKRRKACESESSSSDVVSTGGRTIDRRRTGTVRRRARGAGGGCSSGLEGSEERGE